MSLNVRLAGGSREPAVSSIPCLDSSLPLGVLRSLVSRGGLGAPPSEGGQLCTGSFRMPQKLLAAIGVTHIQPWRKVGKCWQPSETMQARRDFPPPPPPSDDFSLAWRKFLQTFHLHTFALELGRGTGNFSTKEGKEWLEISVSWGGEA